MGVIVYISTLQIKIISFVLIYCLIKFENNIAVGCYELQEFHNKIINQFINAVLLEVIGSYFN